MKLYENIRARRQELKMTQQELAARLGYKSTSTIAKIEAGKSDIPQSKILAFATALDTTVGKLMGWVVKDGGSEIIHRKIDISDKPGGPLLDIQEVALLAEFQRLNDEGKHKVFEYIGDLAEMKKYTAKEKNTSAS